MTRSQTSNSNPHQTGGFSHVPVLLSESIAALAVRPGGRYLDATVGAGGHTRAILEAAEGVRVTAVDRDEAALAVAKANLAEYSDRIEFWHGNFADFPVPTEGFDGILADLGVSSGQLDTPERGFSFRHCAPLDMRMDRQQSLTAADIVNHWDERQLADLFYYDGEERFSRRIARAIVRQRPFQTTTDLASAIARAQPGRSRYVKIHPATRVFQALRIAVNAELKSLETLLDRAPNSLKAGGRIGIISFHSLEDRRVKHGFRDCQQLGVLTKKPIVPQESERVANPRSRSAKLRIAERSNVRSTT
ncbi:MAG: 16S rRNA (cytosine(1402)-N(4))-methyltransferase RsmH [Cyanobacteriota bacterium]|nr:16S rRNA (cytosine(1402)-N(4))-methyltransferase RsmH [Cyanobacteriota bacterium]